MLGCVLRGKVVFISEVERKPAKKPAKTAPRRPATRVKRKAAKPRILAKRAPGKTRRGRSEG